MQSTPNSPVGKSPVGKSPDLHAEVQQFKHLSGHVFFFYTHMHTLARVLSRKNCYSLHCRQYIFLVAKVLHSGASEQAYASPLSLSLSSFPPSFFSFGWCFGGEANGGSRGFHWLQLIPPFGLAMYTRSVHVAMRMFLTSLRPSTC